MNSAGSKMPTIPPSLGLWFSQSKCPHRGEDLKTAARMEGILSSRGKEEEGRLEVAVGGEELWG